MLRSGWIVNEGGMRLIGVNSSDGLWNLALIEELKNHFPPDHPAFAEVPLKGYHFIYHLLLALTSKITNISSINLYFHIFPLIISFLWGFGVYKVVLEVFKNRRAALWSTFFSYFGSSFAFLLPLIWEQNLNLSSAIGICQPYDCSIVNPAFTSSVVLVIWSLYFLIKYLRTQIIKWAVLLAIASGISVGFKVYAGMILMGALLIAAIWRLIYSKKIDLALTFVGALSISALVFFPFNGNYGFLVYQPLWPPHRVMQGPLNFTKWDELWEIYSYYSNYFGILKLEIWANFVFFFGNLGIRILAIVLIIKAGKSTFTNIKFVYFIAMLIISYFVPMFFIQPSGGPFNMIQLYWYFLFLLALIMGPAIEIFAKKIKNKNVLIGFYFLLIALTIPSNINVFLETAFSNGASINNARIKLLQFLHNYEDYDKTVLEIPNISDYELSSLESWFNSQSGPLIPALGGKRVYIADEVALFPHEDKKRRLKLIQKFMQPEVICTDKTQTSGNCQKTLTNSYEILQDENISLIYSKKSIYWLDRWNKTKVIFSNSEGVIYEVLSM